MRTAPALILALALGTGAAPEAGAGLPAFRPPLTDDAMLLTPPDRIELSRRVATLMAEHGIDLRILTVTRLADFGHSKASLEAFARQVFDAWAIGRRPRNDGALLLVAKEDRCVRVELGAGWGRSLDHVMARVVAEEIVPRFRDGQASAAVLAGGRAVADALGRGRVEDVPGPVLPATPRGPSGADPELWQRILLVLFLGSLVAAACECVVRGTSGYGWAWFTLLGTLAFTLLMIFLTPRRGRSHRSWSSSGGGGWSGGGSSGGGGFSGGGGASGSW